jgi:hypothetical protein
VIPPPLLLCADDPLQVSGCSDVWCSTPWVPFASSGASLLRPHDGVGVGYLQTPRHLMSRPILLAETSKRLTYEEQAVFPENAPSLRESAWPPPTASTATLPARYRLFRATCPCERAMLDISNILDWCMYLKNALLNTFFFASDFVLARGIANAMGETDVNEAHRKLLGDVAPIDTAPARPRSP